MTAFDAEVGLPGVAHDEWAVGQVVVGSLRAIGTDDVDLYVGYYLPDGTNSLPFGQASGHQELRELFVGVRDMSIGLREVAFVPQVRVDGDRARCETATAIYAIANPPPRLIATTLIRDELVRHKGRWRIAHRVTTPDASWSPEVGDVADVIGRLESRVRALEEKLA